jgi:plasmid stabilization system protein ParE
LIALTPEAARQVEALERFYVDRQRAQALRNLGYALAEAGLIITNAPERGLPAPRPYPELASLGLGWLKRGRYWIAYDPVALVIAGVFFETDDIPDRIG